MCLSLVCIMICSRTMHTRSRLLQIRWVSIIIQRKIMLAKYVLMSVRKLDTASYFRNPQSPKVGPRIYGGMRVSCRHCALHIHIAVLDSMYSLLQEYPDEELSSVTARGRARPLITKPSMSRYNPCAPLSLFAALDTGLMLDNIQAVPQ